MPAPRDKNSEAYRLYCERISKALKGRKFSTETREKMRQAKLGEQNPFYGRKHSKKVVDNMRRTGSKVFNELWKDPEWAARRASAMAKLGKTQKGRKRSDEFKNNLSKNNGMKRPEIREKHAASLPRGEDHWRWNPDREQVFAPYTELFHDPLYRTLLWRRQDGTCPVCGEEMSGGFDANLHHVDFDKGNDMPYNLLWVHRGCHQRRALRNTPEAVRRAYKRYSDILTSCEEARERWLEWYRGDSVKCVAIE